MASAKKALRAGLVVLLCGVGPSVVYAWDEPKGYQGVPWGTSRATAEKQLGITCPPMRDACFGLVYIRTAKGLVKTNSLLTFEPGVGGLVQYSLAFASKEFELVRAAFLEIYGEPTQPTFRGREGDFEHEILRWMSQTVVITLSRYVNVAKGQTDRGMALVQTRKAWERSRDAKSGREDR
jgi:hypothetical protein